MMGVEDEEIDSSDPPDDDVGERAAERLTEAQRAQVVSVLPMVDDLVTRMARSAPRWLRDDLRSAGRFGAMTAAQRWREGGPTKYSTFARTYIVGAMLDHLRGRKRWRRLLRAASLAARAFAAETPEDAQVGWDEDAVTREKLVRFLRRAASAMTADMSVRPPDPEAALIDAEAHTAAVRIIQQGYRAMEERHRKLYRLRYAEGKDLKECARMLGIAEITARRWHEEMLDAVFVALHAAGITEMPEPRGHGGG